MTKTLGISPFHHEPATARGVDGDLATASQEERSRAGELKMRVGNMGAADSRAAEPVARRPVRIGFVVHTFDQGGLERCVARLVNRLPVREFSPTIICLDRDGSAREWLRRDDVPVVCLRKRPGNSVRVVWRLARVLRRHGFHIVQSNNWGTLLETCLARRLAKTPWHVHAERGMTSVLHHGTRAWLRARAARWALDRADAITTPAESIRRDLSGRCGQLKRPVEVIPNGVEAPSLPADPQHRQQLRRSLGISAGAFVIGSVGRMVPIKAFETAIRAADRLVQSGADVHLLLVGDGPLREQLAGQVRSTGLETRVHLVGRQTDIGAWLAAMDTYINVSHNEGMSQSILEAMAVGLPLVVTDVGDSALVVDREDGCGLVVPPRDDRAVSDAIAKLIANPELCRLCGKNARSRYETRYRVERMIDAFAELYRKTLGLRKD